MNQRIRVLVVDDSAAARDAVKVALAEAADIDVVGTASDGLEAVAMTKALSPNVVTLDINMPRLDGLGAIRTIMAESPVRILVVCAVGDELEVDLSFRAVAAGALELVAKPRPARGEDFGAWAARLREAVRLMAEVPVVRRRPVRPSQAPVLPGTGRRVDAIGIAASTGGPPALARILGALPERLPVPILVVQHLNSGFSAGLARWLASETRLPTALAMHGDTCRPGHVYIAPGGRDLTVTRRGTLELVDESSRHSPSANRLFASMAEAYTFRAGGIVLTGMGDDGAEGLLAIRRVGGVTLAQDDASSVVAGMPQAARRLGGVSHVVSLADVPGAICELCALSERPKRM